VTDREALLERIVAADRPSNLRPVLAEVEAWMREHPTDYEVLATAEQPSQLLAAYEANDLSDLDRPTDSGS